MIEHITIGEIAVGLSFLMGFFGGIGYFYKNIKKWLEKIKIGGILCFCCPNKTTNWRVGSSVGRASPF